MLLVGCYFTVLIDQAMHYHFGGRYREFERKTRYPKAVTTFTNPDPSVFLRAEFAGCAPVDEVLGEAIPVMEEEFLNFCCQHLPGFDGPVAWDVIVGYVARR
jgi:hypothetical protein